MTPPDPGRDRLRRTVAANQVAAGPRTNRGAASQDGSGIQATPPGLDFRGPSLGRFADSRMTTQASERNFASTMAMLDARDKIRGYIDGDAARVQGDRAISQLDQLDPTSEDYQDRVAGVMRQNPKASISPTVAAFLGYQGAAAQQAQAERDDAKKWDYFEKTEAYRASSREEEQLAQQEAQQQEIIKSALLTFDDEATGIFKGLTEFGLSEEEAIHKAAKWQQAQSLRTELLADPSVDWEDPQVAKIFAEDDYGIETISPIGLAKYQANRKRIMANQVAAEAQATTLIRRIDLQEKRLDSLKTKYGGDPDFLDEIAELTEEIQFMKQSADRALAEQGMRPLFRQGPGGGRPASGGAPASGFDPFGPLNFDDI